MTEPILAVDLGTATTSGALVTGDEVRLLKEPASGLYSLPTSVAWDGQTLLVGTLAERRRRSHPGLYLRGFLRDLSRRPKVVLAQRSYAPHELVAAVLDVLKAEAERLNGGKVDRLLLTVPAGRGPGSPTGDEMIAGGTAAEFTDMELLPAPVAVTLDPESADETRFGRRSCGSTTGTAANCLCSLKRTNAAEKVSIHYSSSRYVLLGRSGWSRCSPRRNPRASGPGWNSPTSPGKQNISSAKPIRSRTILRRSPLLCVSAATG